MDNSLKKYINKLISIYQQYREKIIYLIVGGLTTVIYLLIYWILRTFISNYVFPTVLAWIVAVVFAFYANKYIVFLSYDKTNFVEELIKFFGARLVSLVMDIGLKWLMIDVLTINELISTLVIQVIVIVANYFFSKFFIFTK